MNNISLRDYYAGQAMQVLLQTITEFPDEHWRTGLAKDAYAMADAMLAVRGEEQPATTVEEILEEDFCKDAPEWANWHANDEDGRGFWFQAHPERGGDIWFTTSDDSHYCLSGHYADGKGWKQSLRERPFSDKKLT